MEIYSPIPACLISMVYGRAGIRSMKSNQWRVVGAKMLSFEKFNILLVRILDPCPHGKFKHSVSGLSPSSGRSNGRSKDPIELGTGDWSRPLHAQVFQLEKFGDEAFDSSCLNSFRDHALRS
ncbi:hypothetical protein KM043_017593 [Ampulex compressa]|nr:hypothetical protein KM043_017593 [Ampulex compressa]